MFVFGLLCWVGFAWRLVLDWYLCYSCLGVFRFGLARMLVDWVWLTWHLFVFRFCLGCFVVFVFIACFVCVWLIVICWVLAVVVWFGNVVDTDLMVGMVCCTLDVCRFLCRFWISLFAGVFTCDLFTFGMGLV